MEREPGWSSRNERTDVDFDGAVVREDGSCHVVKVTNVSEDGERPAVEHRRMGYGQDCRSCPLARKGPLGSYG